PAVAAALERRQRDVEAEGAVDRSEGEADCTGSGGDAEVHRRRTSGGAGGAAQAAVVRERQRRGVAEGRVDVAVEAPLDAEGARVVLVRLDDPRFDFNLRLRLVEGDNQLVGERQTVAQVGD